MNVIQVIYIYVYTGCIKSIGTLKYLRRYRAKKKIEIRNLQSLQKSIWWWLRST